MDYLYFLTIAPGLKTALGWLIFALILFWPSHIKGSDLMVITFLTIRLILFIAVCIGYGITPNKEQSEKLRVEYTKQHQTIQTKGEVNEQK